MSSNVSVGREKSQVSTDSPLPEVLRYNGQLVQALGGTESLLPSPIDLNLRRAKQIALERLQWVNYDTMPERLTLTNTGETVVLSGRWPPGKASIPSLQGGPLGDRRYQFSQLHFHWGRSALDGSEHTIEGSRMPLELHVVHFDERLRNLQAAERAPGGVICLVYLFRLQASSSSFIEPIVSSLCRVRLPYSQLNLKPFPLDALLHTFSDEYFLYWGRTRAPGLPTPYHVPMLWLVSRAQERLSFEQLKQFDVLLDQRMRPLHPVASDVANTPRRHLFHVNPRSTPSEVGTLLVEPPRKYSQSRWSSEDNEH